MCFVTPYLYTKVDKFKQTKKTESTWRAAHLIELNMCITSSSLEAEHSRLDLRGV